MNTRNKKPTVYIIATEETYKTQMQWLPTIKRDFTENFNIIHIEAAATRQQLYDFPIQDNEVNNYLIHLATSFHPVTAIFDKTFPVTGDRGGLNNPSQSDYLKRTRVNEAFIDSIVGIDTFESIANNCVTYFKEAHKRRKDASMVPFFLRRSHITQESTLKEILKDALHKSSSDAMKVAIELGWLDESGEFTNETPEPVKIAMRKISAEQRKQSHSPN